MKTYRYTITKYRDNIERYKHYCTDKTVLECGFTDWPKTRPYKNFYKTLAPYTKWIDGYDVNKPDNVEELRVENGDFIWDWDEIDKDKYDVITCREVIEHVGDVETFLKQFDDMRGVLMIQTPCAYLLKERGHFGYDATKNQYYEKNHEDHNCWYTPFTLHNTIRKYSKREPIEMSWVNNHSILLVLGEAK